MGASESKKDLVLAAQRCSGGEMMCECDSDMFQLFKADDDGNDPKMIYQLGMCHHFGWGTAKDLKAAVKCYVKAAEIGNIQALKQLKEMSDDQSVKIDLQNAFRCFSEKAGQGDARAQFNLNAGYCYFYGIGISRDRAKGRDLFQMAADQKCADAMWMLDVCRQNNVGDGYNGMQEIQLLKYAAELGSVEAPHQLGYLYFFGMTIYGLKVEQDRKQAVEWYQKAADQSHAEATYWLAQCYYNGQGVQKNAQKAFQLYKKAALMGNREAQYIISIFYRHKMFRLSEDEYPVDIDYLEAAYWNRKAVDQDKYDAKESMLDILKSIGLAQDQIFELIKQKSSFELAKTWYDVAKQYETGDGVKKDKQKAFQMYRLAARFGGPEGQVSLARCYELGIGTEKSIKHSIRWNIRAAMQGNTEAAQTLQKWLRQNNNQSSFKSQESMLTHIIITLKQLDPEQDSYLDILLCIIDPEGKQQTALIRDFFNKGQDPSNNIKTFEMCKLAIEYDMRAVYWMVRHYQHSINIVDDFASIPQLLEQDAASGNAESVYCIARCHMHGLGTPNNPAKAISCYKFAVQQNHAAAQCELGCCYENGTWVKKHICDAIELYKKAADQNYIPALKTLAVFYESDDQQMKDLHQAFQYHKRAAEQGDADEQLHIAECYRNGIAVQQSAEDALYWYEKAAANGKAEGYTYIAECYEKGIETQVDFLKACTAYQAANPSAPMQHLLMDIIQRNKNVDDTDFNPEQAFEVCLKLTEIDPNDANWGRLAEYYENGIGTPVNFQNAFYCCSKMSQTQQKQDSLLRLAQKCEDGISTTINMELAFKAYLHLANAFPTPENLLKIAEMLENGIGTEADIEQAIKYYGQARAFAKLGDLYYEGQKVGKNLLKAGEYYLQAKQLTRKQLQILHDIMPIFSKLQQDELKYFHVVKNIADVIRHESNQIVIPVE